MQVVEILNLSAAEDGTIDDIIAGRLTWDGSGDIQAWSTDDKYSVLMQNILNEPIHVDDEEIDSIDNPKEFMDGLRYQYTSAYLRATEPREVDDAEITAFAKRDLLVAKGASLDELKDKIRTYIRDNYGAIAPDSQLSVGGWKDKTGNYTVTIIKP